MNYALQVNNLSKRYGNKMALDGLTLNVKKGSVHALVGPNGSGKTTLIRILMGTSIKTSGEYSLFGINDGKVIHKCRNRIGTLIETPRFFNSKTAYDNLDYIQRMRDVKEQHRIDEVLEIVGLMEVKNKRVGKYSLGMKQRLGIARALLGSPDMLILDEPINGLDPKGVADVRNMIYEFKKQGITVVIASHILKELTIVATEYSMIKNGKIFDEFSSDELKNRCGEWLEIESNKPNQVKELLKKNAGEIKIDGNKIMLFDSNIDANNIMRLLVHNGVEVEGCTKKVNDLEDYFLKMMGE